MLECTSGISLHYSLHAGMAIDTMCITRITQLLPASVSRSYSIMASMFISIFTWCWFPSKFLYPTECQQASAFAYLHNHSLQFRTIIPSNGTFWLAQLHPQSAFRNSVHFGLQGYRIVILNYCLQGHLWTHLITATNYISMFTWLRPSGEYLYSLNFSLHILLWLCSGTIYSQVVHIYIYWESLINTCHIVIQQMMGL